MVITKLAQQQGLVKIGCSCDKWLGSRIEIPALNMQYIVQSSKFFIPIKGPEEHTDNTCTVTYTFIIKTQDCGIIIIIYIFFL